MKPNKQDAMEIPDLLTEIKREAANLRTLFLSREEREGIKSVLASFDRCMAENVRCTLKNMDIYRMYGWRELCGGREETGDTSESGNAAENSGPENEAGDGDETGCGEQKGVGE